MDGRMRGAFVTAWLPCRKEAHKSQLTNPLMTFKLHLQKRIAIINQQQAVTNLATLSLWGASPFMLWEREGHPQAHSLCRLVFDWRVYLRVCKYQEEEDVAVLGVKLGTQLWASTHYLSPAFYWLQFQSSCLHLWNGTLSAIINLIALNVFSNTECSISVGNDHHNPHV